MGKISKMFRLSVENTPGEQIPIADALSRIDFDVEESNNNRVCSAINTNYIAQSNLMTQAELKIELGTHTFFHDITKRIRSRIWKQCSEAKKNSISRKVHLPYTMNHLQRNHSTQTMTRGFGKSS